MFESLILKYLRCLTSVAGLSLFLNAPFLAGNHKIETITIIQDNPVIKHIDFGVPGDSHGEMLAFEASFADKDGKVMSGIITVVLHDGNGLIHANGLQCVARRTLGGHVAAVLVV
jgi:hypothetical protein